MVNEVKTINDKDIQHPCGYSWGDRPKGILKTISEIDFWHIMGSYSPSYTGINQIYNDIDDFRDNRSDKVKTSTVSVSLFYFGDYVLLVEYEYWQKRVNYWKIMDCDHDYREISASEANKLGIHHFGNCYHIYKCSICNKTKSVDSSG
ncbi:MAG: hypothetical protein ACTSP9_03170 [Promethearchaeota archaeon]